MTEPDTQGEPVIALRRDDRAMPLADVWALLERSAVGRVATAGPDGQPYVVPVSHVVMDGEVLFHHIAHGGHLNANLAADSRVCFEVDEQLGVVVGDSPGCATSVEYRSVVVMGRARRVEDDWDKARVCAALTEKYVPGAGASADQFLGRTGGVAIYAITAERITGKQSVGGAP